jgi:hypothetical protein
MNIEKKNGIIFTGYSLHANCLRISIQEYVWECMHTIQEYVRECMHTDN